MVVDDHLLLRVLLGDEPSDLRRAGGRLVTTGLWYHRLCRALGDTTVVGSMSRVLGGVDDRAARTAVESVVDLPDWIELVSLRALGWPMADLVAHGAQVNLLSLEALAAARHLDAAICLATADENPPLVQAARAYGIDVRMLR